VSNSRIILVAEDSPSDTILLKRAFFRANIRIPVIFLDDGQQMIDYLTRSRAGVNDGSSPVLVMVDLAMPKVGGLEVLGWVREQSDLGTLPVVVFSGLNRPIDISRAYALGADLFLIKTADPNQWTIVLHRIAEMYGLMEQIPPPGAGIINLSNRPAAGEDFGRRIL
jgi:two-component system response regulator